MGRKFANLGAAIAVVLMMTARIAQAGAPDFAEGKRHFLKGVRFYGSRDFPRALKEFEASYAQNPVGDVLYNIALTQKALGRTSDAIASLERYLLEAKPTMQAKSDAERVLSELRAKQAVLQLDPESAHLTSDGRPNPQPAATPPPSAVTVGSPAPQSSDVTVGPPAPTPPSSEATVGPPSPAVTEPEATPAAPATSPWPTRKYVVARFISSPRGIATVVLASVGAASLISAAAFGGVALAKRNDLNASCRSGVCNRSIYDAGHTMAIASDVLISVGAAAVATGAILVLTRPRHRLAVAPTVTNRLATISIGGEF